MQTRNPFFDDMARMAGGAMSALAGVRCEAEAQIRTGIDRMVRELDLVTREEHDAAREMAAKARTEQESLTGRLAILEARVAELEAAAKPTRKPAAGKEG